MNLPIDRGVVHQMVMPFEEPAKPAFDLNHVVGVIRANRPAILGILLGALGLALAVTMLATPKYMAAASVQINELTDQVLGESHDAQQMINILTEQNVEISLSKLGARDILISPDLTGVNFVDFERGEELVGIGEAAARAAIPRLAALAMTEAVLRRLGATPDQIDREHQRLHDELFGVKAGTQAPGRT